MKFLKLILFISVAFNGQSQNKFDIVLDFKISCGSGARTSEEIQAFKKIADLNDTAIINDKLFNGSKIEKVLSVITLKYYQTTGSLQLTGNQKKVINRISKLKDKFSLCVTCTFQQSGTVKKLFHDKKFLESYSIIEFYLAKKS